MNFRILLSTLFVTLTAAASLPAQSDLYSFPKIEEEKIKVKEAPPPDPFVQALSKRFDLPDSLLTEYVQKGFGRAELLRLILVSKKADKPLPDLLKDRAKGTRLAKITESAGLDNRAVRREALDLLKELQKEEKRIREQVQKSSAPTAGVGDTIPKDD